MKVIVYSLPLCPNCEALKTKLKLKGIPFEEQDMQSPESITEMRVNGCFAMEAPVLEIAYEMATEFYEYKEITEDILEEILLEIRT